MLFRARRGGGRSGAGSFAKRTTMLWVLWFGMVFSYYGIFSWLPTILADKLGVKLGLEFNVIITLAQIPGYFVAAWLVEWLGRKYTLALFLTGAAFGSFFFRNATTLDQLTIYGCVISFFALGAWGVIYTYTPELYPTRIRGWGAGMASGLRAHWWHLRPLHHRAHHGHPTAANRHQSGVSHLYNHLPHYSRQCPGPGRRNQRPYA